MSYYVNYITFYILEALMQLLPFIYTHACIQIYINIEYNIINTFLIYLCIFFPFFFRSFATVVYGFTFKSLTTSRIVPRFTRPVTDMIVGYW